LDDSVKRAPAAAREQGPAGSPERAVRRRRRAPREGTRTPGNPILRRSTMEAATAPGLSDLLALLALRLAVHQL